MTDQPTACGPACSEQHTYADDCQMVTRRPAYDAVYAYIRTLPREAITYSAVERNAAIWRAVNAALDAQTNATSAPVADLTAAHAELEGFDPTQLIVLPPSPEPTIDPAAVASMRDRIRRALADAAYDCTGGCGKTEADCDAAHPVQVAAYTFGKVSDIWGSIDAIADAADAAVQKRLAPLRQYLELTADSCNVGHRGVARDALRLLDGDTAAPDGEES